MITPFQERVYSWLKNNVPKGSVTTYGAIAKGIDRPFSSRAIGNALHNNPFSPEVPCHRVVNAKGELSQHFGLPGGIHTQKKLLEAEGVIFIDEFTIKLRNNLL